MFESTKLEPIITHSHTHTLTHSHTHLVKCGVYALRPGPAVGQGPANQDARFVIFLLFKSCEVIGQEEAPRGALEDTALLEFREDPPTGNRGWGSEDLTTVGL